MTESTGQEEKKIMTRYKGRKGWVFTVPLAGISPRIVGLCYVTNAQIDRPGGQRSCSDGAKPYYLATNYRHNLAANIMPARTGGDVKDAKKGSGLVWCHDRSWA